MWLLLTGSALAASPARQLVCVEHGGSPSDLNDHPVAIVLDTQAPCDDLRVVDGAGASLDHWVEEGTCGTPATTVWVRVPSLPVGGVATVVVVRGDPAAADPADGQATFPFFDDFSGNVLDGRWDGLGSAQRTLDGDTLQTDGPAAIWSSTPVMTLGATELVARIDAVGDWGTDVELGAGFIAGPQLWQGNRDWVGFTHLSYDGAYFTVAAGPSPGPSCTTDQYPAGFLPTAGQPRGWRRVRVGFDTNGTETTAWLETDAGVRIDRVADAGCRTEDSLPALLVLDHENSSGDPTQRVDFVFVRPTADPEPVPVLVPEGDPDGDGLPSSVEGCGDADGDGIADWEDPPEPEPTPGDTGTPTIPGTDTGVAPVTRPLDPGDEALGGRARGAGCGCAGSPPGRLGGLALLVLALATRMPSRRRATA